MKKLIKSGNADEAFSIFISRNWVENDDYRKFENKFISCQGKLDAGKALSSSDVSALTKLADNLLLKK